MYSNSASSSGGNDSLPAFRKFKKGSSGGAYTDAYHRLVGSSPWIIVKRLLPPRRYLAAVNAAGGGKLSKNENIMNNNRNTTTSTSGSSSNKHHHNSDHNAQTANKSGGAATSPFHLSEGDLVTVFSQFGEVADIRFVRHRKTGRFLGTAYIKFVDFRSGIAAADEMNSDPENGEICDLYPQLMDHRWPSSSAGENTEQPTSHTTSWMDASSLLAVPAGRGAVEREVDGVRTEEKTVGKESRQEQEPKQEQEQEQEPPFNRGIIVDRCQECEVPDMSSLAPSSPMELYPDWLKHCVKSPSGYFWELAD